MDKQTENICYVVVREAQDITPGDTIWAPEDGDWFEVVQISSGGIYDQKFTGHDEGIAEFFDNERVLVRVQP